MKKVFFATLLIVGYIVLRVSVPCFGADQAKEWECLFCHQYPGLVMPEKPDKFKVISIDKEKHFSSPHGKIGCTRCHTLINKVPHTGLKAIECTTECHLEDKEREQTLFSCDADKIVFDNRLNAAEIRKETYRFKIPEDAKRRRD